jgi:sialic acid synthase SpsE
LFPTVSDTTALEFAEKHATPAYKIASFEIGDRDLLRAVAATGKPTLISDGCATEDDYDFIYSLFSHVRCPHLILHCVSDYPAQPSLEVLDWVSEHSPVGLSDHTVGVGFPLWCASFGLSVLEKHLYDGAGDCADREFSLSPNEFKFMVDAIRAMEDAQTHVVATDAAAARAKPSSPFQRSIYVVRPVVKGQRIEREDLRIVRPGYGLDPRLIDHVVGRTAVVDIPYGTALKENYYR